MIIVTSLVDVSSLVVAVMDEDVDEDVPMKDMMIDDDKS